MPQEIKCKADDPVFKSGYHVSVYHDGLNDKQIGKGGLFKFSGLFLLKLGINQGVYFHF